MNFYGWPSRTLQNLQKVLHFFPNIMDCSFSKIFGQHVFIYIVQEMKKIVADQII